MLPGPPCYGGWYPYAQLLEKKSCRRFGPVRPLLQTSIELLAVELMALAIELLALAMLPTRNPQTPESRGPTAA